MKSNFGNCLLISPKHLYGSRKINGQKYIFYSVGIFVAAFIYMDLKMVSASMVFLALITLTVIGYILSILLEISDAYETLLHTG